MTRKEKIDMIDKYCRLRDGCEGCPAQLKAEGDDGCVNTNWRTNEELDEAIQRMEAERLESSPATEPEEPNRSEPQPDPVNKAAHYHLPGGMECWDVMVAMFGEEQVRIWCKLNAFTYLFRHAKKNGEEDIRKALVNLQKYFELGGEAE